jgi:hypothetical protein
MGVFPSGAELSGFARSRLWGGVPAIWLPSDATIAVEGAEALSFSYPKVPPQVSRAHAACTAKPVSSAADHAPLCPSDHPRLGCLDGG